MIKLVPDGVDWKAYLRRRVLHLNMDDDADFEQLIKARSAEAGVDVPPARVLAELVARDLDRRGLIPRSRIAASARATPPADRATSSPVPATSVASPTPPAEDAVAPSSTAASAQQPTRVPSEVATPARS